MTKILELKNIEKIYKQGSEVIKVLNKINLTVLKGETIALVGQSGSGKSTLLHIAGFLDDYDQGEIWIEDKPIVKPNDKEASKIRSEKIGFVFQAHYLLHEFTALENVMMARLTLGVSKKQAQEEAAMWLEKVGLSHRLKHLPSQLSGGEQQRISIARALVNSPLLLLADEPTGNLDPQTADHVFEIFQSVMQESGASALIATHNFDLARKLGKIIELKQGILSQS
jgi:lipoprotein-releasing system ATP-binding protein